MKIGKEEWEKIKRTIRKAKRGISQEDLEDIAISYFIRKREKGDIFLNINWVIADFYQSQSYWNPRSGPVSPGPLSEDIPYIQEENPLLGLGGIDRLLMSLLMDGYTIRELSERLSISEQLVRKRLKSAANRLSGKDEIEVDGNRKIVGGNIKIEDKIVYRDKIVEVPITMEVAKVKTIEEYSKDAIIFMREKGATWEEIAAQLGVTIRCIRDMRKRFGLRDEKES